MRTTFPLMIAIALTGSSPALAQDTNNTAVADTAGANDVASTDNAMTADPLMTADPANDLANAPMPIDQPVETVPAAAPARGGFPWGVIGLLGLIGLMPRKRRD